MFGARGAIGTHVLSHAEVPRPTEAVNAYFLNQTTKENTAIMMGLPGTTHEYVEDHFVQVGDEFLYDCPASIKFKDENGYNDLDIKNIFSRRCLGPVERMERVSCDMWKCRDQPKP